MTTTKLWLGNATIAECLTWEIAERILPYHSEVVKPKILGAITTRYNGQKPKDILRDLTNEEKSILSEVRDSFDGNFLATQEKYLKKILEDPADTYLQNEKIAQNAVIFSMLEGMMQYEHRHDVKLLDRIARFQKITGKDLLKQTE